MAELFGAVYEPFREEAAANLERTRGVRAQIMAGSSADGTHLDYLLRLRWSEAALARWREIARAYELEADEMAWLKFKAGTVER